MANDVIIINFKSVEVHRVTYKNGRKVQGFFYIIDREKMINRVFQAFNEECRRFFNSLVPDSEAIPLF